MGGKAAIDNGARSRESSVGVSQVPMCTAVLIILSAHLADTLEPRSVTVRPSYPVV